MKYKAIPITEYTELDGVRGREHEEANMKTKTVNRKIVRVKLLDEKKEHDCWQFASFYTSDGPLGHGWVCAKCKRLLQVG